MKQKQWLVTSAVLVIVTILFVAMAMMAFKVGPKYDFQEAVHGHVLNAESSPTPELVIENLLLARTGMVDLGLTPDMYGRLMPWKQTPDWRMDYQYARIDAVIERCDEVIAWRDNQDLTSGQIADVYKEKMDAIKELIDDGGLSGDIDYLAYRAYMIEKHKFLYLMSPVIAIALLGLTGSACFNYSLLTPDSYSRHKTDPEGRFDKDDRLMLACIHGILWVLVCLPSAMWIVNW